MQNRFRYCGEQYDSITGQYYLRARYYNPVIGRLLQEDTYYKDGLNLYSYCKNNPVYYADPSGHEVTPATQRLTGDQQALFDIAGELNGKGGASVDDAAIMMQWAAQYEVPYEKLQLQNQLLLEGPTTTQKPKSSSGVTDFYVTPEGSVIPQSMYHSLSNVDARKWYLSQETTIPDLIDYNQTLDQQAYQAFSLRNKFRTTARELMADRESAESLYITDPNQTWEELIQKQVNKGLSGDDIYMAIVQSSQRSRKSVNKSLGLE